MNNCIGCNHETEQNWCDYCQLLAPHILEISLESLGLGESSSENLRAKIGSPLPSIPHVWKALANSQKSGIDWLSIENNKNHSIQQWIVEPPRSWTITPSQIEELESENRIRNSDTLRDMHRGGILPNGTYVSFAEGVFYLDGNKINLPYRDIEKMIRMPGADKVNWDKLLISLHIATANFRPRRERNSSQVLTPKKMISHPITYSFIRKNVRMRDMGWADLLDYGSLKTDPYEELATFFDNNKWLCSKTPWMKSWIDPERNGSIQGASKTVPMSLLIRKGRLKILVRRSQQWRTICVPNDPEIWALLINWSLIRPGHPDRINLNVFQQQLFLDPNVKLMKEKDINGINFLREIVNNNNRAMIMLGSSESENKIENSIKVQGTSGEYYKITPGKEAHNTRFRVTTIGGALSSRSRFRHRRRIPLCIVEEPALRKLVIGDAIGSIVLALLNDLDSQKQIYTLSAYLRRLDEERTPGENEQALENARDQLEIQNRLENLVRDHDGDLQLVDELERTRWQNELTRELQRRV